MVDVFEERQSVLVVGGEEAVIGGRLTIVGLICYHPRWMFGMICGEIALVAFIFCLIYGAIVFLWFAERIGVRDKPELSKKS